MPCFLNKNYWCRKSPESVTESFWVFTCTGVVLPEYSRVRVPDDHAIADLAMYNYVEVIQFNFYFTCTFSYISFS